VLIIIHSGRLYSSAMFDVINVEIEEEYERQWARFREKVLKPGGSTHEVQLLHDFFGEEITLGAMIERIGADIVQ
jgi:Zn-dependent oligopeptidase